MLSFVLQRQKNPFPGGLGASSRYQRTGSEQIRCGSERVGIRTGRFRKPARPDLTGKGGPDKKRSEAAHAFMRRSPRPRPVLLWFQEQIQTP